MTENIVRFVLDDNKWREFCEALERPAVEIESLRSLLTEPSILDE